MEEITVTALKENLRTNKLFPAIMAVLVAGLVATLTDIIPMAAFVFSGNLEPYVAMGIGINLFSSAILGLVIALRKANPTVEPSGSDPLSRLRFSLNQRSKPANTLFTLYGQET